MATFIKIFILVLILLYIINPFDLISDLIPLIGWFDDAALIGILFYYLKRSGKLFDFLSWFGVSFKTNRFDYQYNENHENATNQGANSESTAEASQQSALKNPYEILKIEPGASPEEIQAAYRKAVQAYHPDKVSHLGEELQKMAQQKFIEIQDAYEKIYPKK